MKSKIVDALRKRKKDMECMSEGGLIKEGEMPNESDWDDFLSQDPQLQEAPDDDYGDPKGVDDFELPETDNQKKRMARISKALRMGRMKGRTGSDDLY